MHVISRLSIQSLHIFYTYSSQTACVFNNYVHILNTTQQKNAFLQHLPAKCRLLAPVCGSSPRCLRADWLETVCVYSDGKPTHSCHTNAGGNDGAAVARRINALSTYADCSHKQYPRAHPRGIPGMPLPVRPVVPVPAARACVGHAGCCSAGFRRGTIPADMGDTQPCPWRWCP